MRYFILLLIGILAHSSVAATQVDVYKTEIAVENDDSQTIDQARVDGMKQVLLRTTGDLRATDNAQVQKALSETDKYLTQFGFIDVNGQRVLKMEFNARLIRELLTQAHLPLWPNQRSNVLVWLLEDQDYQRTISWENTSSPKVAQLQQAAANRGLPVTIPVGDFQDITSVQVSDLWAGFIQPTSIASHRYGPDAVLIIRDKDNVANWTLFDQSPKDMVEVQITPQMGKATGDNRFERIVNSITQYYVAKNSLLVEGESSNSLLVQVDNLTSPVSFFAAENALNAMNSTASVDVVKIGDLYSIYRVNLLTSREEFEKEAALQAQLIFDEEASLAQSQPVVESGLMLPADSTMEDNSSEQASENENNVVIRKEIPVNPELIYHWR